VCIVKLTRTYALLGSVIWYSGCDTPWTNGKGAHHNRELHSKQMHHEFGLTFKAVIIYYGPEMCKVSTKKLHYFEDVQELSGTINHARARAVTTQASHRYSVFVHK